MHAHRSHTCKHTHVHTDHTCTQYTHMPTCHRCTQYTHANTCTHRSYMCTEHTQVHMYTQVTCANTQTHTPQVYTVYMGKHTHRLHMCTQYTYVLACPYPHMRARAHTYTQGPGSIVQSSGPAALLHISGRRHERCPLGKSEGSYKSLNSVLKILLSYALYSKVYFVIITIILCFKIASSIIYPPLPSPQIFK